MNHDLVKYLNLFFPCGVDRLIAEYTIQPDKETKRKFNNVMFYLANKYSYLKYDIDNAEKLNVEFKHRVFPGIYVYRTNYKYKIKHTPEQKFAFHTSFRWRKQEINFGELEVEFITEYVNNGWIDISQLNYKWLDRYYQQMYMHSLKSRYIRNDRQE